MTSFLKMPPTMFANVSYCHTTMTHCQCVCVHHGSNPCPLQRSRETNTKSGNFTFIWSLLVAGFSIAYYACMIKCYQWYFHGVKKKEANLLCLTSSLIKKTVVLLQSGYYSKVVIDNKLAPFVVLIVSLCILFRKYNKLNKGCKRHVQPQVWILRVNNVWIIQHVNSSWSIVWFHFIIKGVILPGGDTEQYVSGNCAVQRALSFAPTNQY